MQPPFSRSIHSTTYSGSMSSQSPRNGNLLDQHPQSPPIFIGEQEPYGTEYPFTHLGSDAVSPPASCPPWPTRGIEKGGKKESCVGMLAIAKAPVQF